jgi:hypothetical protein
MPTYDYKCRICEHESSVFQSIGDYCRSPVVPVCCYGGMERKLSVSPLMSGIQNSLAGDRNYIGLQATDGTPIDSRTKHRQYMKERGLTIMTDFKGEWQKAAEKRAALRTNTHQDPSLRKEITEQVMRSVAMSDSDKTA